MRSFFGEKVRNDGSQRTSFYEEMPWASHLDRMEGRASRSSKEQQVQTYREADPEKYATHSCEERSAKLPDNVVEKCPKWKAKAPATLHESCQAAPVFWSLHAMPQSLAKGATNLCQGIRRRPTQKHHRHDVHPEKREDQHDQIDKS